MVYANCLCVFCVIESPQADLILISIFNNCCVCEKINGMETLMDGTIKNRPGHAGYFLHGKRFQ